MPMSLVKAGVTRVTGIGQREGLDWIARFWYRQNSQVVSSGHFRVCIDAKGIGRIITQSALALIRLCIRTNMIRIHGVPMGNALSILYRFRPP